MPRIHLRNLTIGDDAIDVHRHVNNQEYLRWMQEVAIEHSTAQGWPMQRYLDTGASWYVRSHFIDYLRPADHAVVAKAETQWIFVDLHNGRPLSIPDDVRSAFEVIEAEADVLREIGWG
jgi:acyl-CoA thioester hydrolase